MEAAHISRRALLLGAAALRASCVLRANDSAKSFEYVGTPHAIEVYRRVPGQKRIVQTVVSENPCALTLDSTGRYLLAVNDIDEFEHLPSGSVESYRVETSSGRLSLVSRTALSLSATKPRHLAISPDRRMIVVAAYGGGVYNVLPISANGEVTKVTQVIKEIGCSVNGHWQSSSHPHSVAFHPSGKFLFGTDSGADRINVFTIDNGHLTCVHRFPAVPGTGPAALLLDPSGTELSVEHEFCSAIHHYRFDAGSGLLIRSRD
jgi:6-phosphogluconolactonase